jgi:uncharacterized protein (DUF2147 family)
MSHSNIFKPLVALLLSLPLASFNYQTKKDITGKWVFIDSKREIEIYVQDSKYFGKTIKVSGRNDKEKVGHIMLRNFVYNQSDRSYSGEINSPEGMTASGKLELLEENKLKFSVKKIFISKTSILKRIK